MDPGVPIQLCLNRKAAEIFLVISDRARESVAIETRYSASHEAVPRSRSPPLDVQDSERYLETAAASPICASGDHVEAVPTKRVGRLFRC